MERLSAAVVIAIALSAGLVIGLVNGVLVTVLRASAVVVTLGTAAIVTGIGFLYSGGAPGNAMPELINGSGRGRIGMVPVSGLVWAAFGVVAFVLLRRLTLGRYIFAAGDNPSAATYFRHPGQTPRC